MLTPLDIRKKEFRRCFRGYDEEEVDAFLDQVIGTVEELIKENGHLQDIVERSEKSVSRYREIEDALKQTMVFAQKNAQELKKNVEKETAVILQEAHAQSEQMITDANRSAEKILEEAERQAEETVGRAQKQAEKSLTEARRQVDDILREYQGIEKSTKVFRSRFRSFLEAQLELLDAPEYGLAKGVDAEEPVAEDYSREGRSEEIQKAEA